MALFDRQVRVRIGKPGSISALDIRELRVKFTAKKTNDSSSNTCQVEIYNLSPDNRSRIKELSNIFILEAGYKTEGVSQVFIGDIVQLEHRYEAPNWISSIQFNDGENALKNSKTAISFKGGVPVKNVMLQIADSFGISKKIVDESSIENVQFANGYSDIGSSKQLLDNVAGKIGVEWSIQDGKLIIRKKGSADSNKAAVLSPDTGLIGSPVRVDKKQPKDAATTPDNRPRWEFTSLMFPGILPGNRIEVSGVRDFSNGVFKVEQITHSGDTHGTEWNSKIQAVAI